MNLILEVPPGFVLKSTVYSHGWYALPPFSVDKIFFALNRIVELSNGKLIFVRLEDGGTTANKVIIRTTSTLTAHEQLELKGTVRSSLRLDEDFSMFYSLAKKMKEYRWIPNLGAGRMLRSPSVFEDVVKMICTTNCSWALTEIMVEKLCSKLGAKVIDSNGSASTYAFPTPEAIADTSEKFIRKEIRAGYRSPYLLELSKRIVKREINIESWRTKELPTEELFKEVRSVKGVGPYAAGNLLKLLGHYDYLGIDSWCRKKFSEKHRKGKKVSDKTIERFYSQFGKWQGLFLWMDLTQYWYEREFPL